MKIILIPMYVLNTCSFLYYLFILMVNYFKYEVSTTVKISTDFNDMPSLSLCDSVREARNYTLIYENFYYKEEATYILRDSKCEFFEFKQYSKRTKMKEVPLTTNHYYFSLTF